MSTKASCSVSLYTGSAEAAGCAESAGDVVSCRAQLDSKLTEREIASKATFIVLTICLL